MTIQPSVAVTDASAAAPGDRATAPGDRTTAPDGSEIFSVTIGSDQLQATIISFGACLQDLRFKGFDYPLVLGFKNIADYTHNEPYLGAVVGRNANRIAHGRCVLDGQTLNLTKASKDQHQLHGGPGGSSLRHWQLVRATANQLVLKDTLPHGHMGFPGNLDVQITYTIAGNVLDVKITARTDQTTVCNFALHNYFNLDNSLSLKDHCLSVAAATYLPTDAGGIPLGYESDVGNWVYDYRQLKSLKHLGSEQDSERNSQLVPERVSQRAPRLGLDHNFCITTKPGKLKPIAFLKSQSSGLSMQLSSTEAGLQVYDGAHLNVSAQQALHERAYGSFSALALEPQGWPNAANEEGFPRVLLQPKQLYSQHTRYHFKAEKISE